MLPFLKPKGQASTVMAKTKPEGGVEEDHGHDGMMAAAEDLIKAIHAKDAKGVAEALSAAHDIGPMKSKDDFLSSEG